MKKVLLTSVCRPLGRRYGDGPSVGYELLFGQVTRAQGLFSPRANHTHYSLDYIAENLEAPATVLHYPTRRELVRELKKGYDYVGVSFILATYWRMKEIVALVRRHSPCSRIVLGGYGTVLSDEELAPYADHVCRGEGVAFMRELLGEPEIPMPYKHPRIVSRLRVFGMEVSRTGMVFAGLGCPNGCDFCCTSHYFKRRHIRLLPTGRDIYRVVRRYLDSDPKTQIAVVDEDFLLNKRRALEFRDCVQEGGRPVSMFVFSSVRAISQFTTTEILEMGIDGVWIGYEGTQSEYPKQSGRPVDELFRELRRNGIGVLASMIVGFPYQTPEILARERAGLLDLQPDFTQFLIYGPVPGTPFYDRVVHEGLLQRELLDDREQYYRKCTGFSSIVNHPTMTPKEIETEQNRSYREDFHRLGPSIFRSVETWLLGYLKLRRSANPLLREKSKRIALEIRGAYPAFLAGKVLAPTLRTRRRIADLEARVHRVMGRPTLLERVQSVLTVGLAAWAALTQKLGLFQHPRLVRNSYRMPVQSLPARVWRRLMKKVFPKQQVEVELRPESRVCVRIKGDLAAEALDALLTNLHKALNRTKDRLVLDLRRLMEPSRVMIERIIDELKAYGDRVGIVSPIPVGI